jgi:hypothetical protein
MEREAMKFSVVGYCDPDGSDLTTIARFDWPRLPRIGETLKLVGPHFGEASAHKHGVDGESLFSVTDVVYSDVVDARGYGGESFPDVEVYVELHEVNRPPMRFRCVCEEIDTENGTECNKCGLQVSQVGRPERSGLG